MFANKAVEVLTKGQENSVVGLRDGKIVSMALEKSCMTEKPFDPSLLRLAKLLAT
jgi:hypothetical protein